MTIDYDYNPFDFFTPTKCSPACQFSSNCRFFTFLWHYNWGENLELIQLRLDDKLSTPFIDTIEVCWVWVLCYEFLLVYLQSHFLSFHVSFCRANGKRWEHRNQPKQYHNCSYCCSRSFTRDHCYCCNHSLSKEKQVGFLSYDMYHLWTPNNPF